MDIVAPAIIAALTLLSEPVVKDAYDKLKATLADKFGDDGELAEAVVRLEQKPDSAGRRETLREELGAARADRDEDVIRAAEGLLEKLRAQPGGQQLIQQNVTGDRNIFSATGDVTVHKKS